MRRDSGATPYFDTVLALAWVRLARLQLGKR